MSYTKHDRIVSGAEIYASDIKDMDNKIYDHDSDISDLQDSVDVLEPTASSSDVGKALKVKTVAGGKATAYEFGETAIIDNTLTQTGQAADAKKTGDEITGLKSALNELNDGTDVEFSIAVGTITSDSIQYWKQGNAICVYFKCKPNTTYSITKNIGNRFMVCWTSETPAKDVTANGYINYGNTETLAKYTTGESGENGYVVMEINTTGLSSDDVFAAVDIKRLYAMSEIASEIESVSGEVKQYISSFEESLLQKQHLIKSENLFNKDSADNLPNSYIDSATGAVRESSGRYVTHYIDVHEYAGKYLICSYFNATQNKQIRTTIPSVAVFDKQKQIIRGGATNVSNYPIPDSAYYLRLTVAGNVISNDGNLGIYDDADTDTFVYYEYFEPFYVYDNNFVNIKSVKRLDNRMGMLQTKSDLSDGQQFQLPYHNVKNHNVLCFTANIISFDSVKIGKQDDTYITVDATNVTITNDQGTFVKPHLLSIHDSIQIRIENTDSLNTSKISVCSCGEEYVDTDPHRFLMDQGEPYAISIGSELTDCVFSWTSRHINKPIWLFGDSYFSWYSQRWPYYLARDGFLESCMLNGYAGENSVDAYRALKTLLSIRIPEYVVWCQGMNNGDSATGVSGVWKKYYDRLVLLSETYGFELILATIPSTPTITNEFKNDIVRNSGYRYIDFASAVNVDEYGNWIAGTMEDNVHPNALGAKILYYKVLSDFPEIMSKS